MIDKLFSMVRNLSTIETEVDGVSNLTSPRSTRLLDALFLEDRLLFNAAPVDAAVLEGGEAPLLEGAVVISPDAFDPHTDPAGEHLDPAPGEADDDHHGDDHHDENAHFDIFGNEYHALTLLPTFDASVGDLVNDDGTSPLAYPLTDTFRLHSNPGALHTIYLDFDGHITSGTSWNASFNGGQNIVTPAFDFDGNVNSFSNEELMRIQRIWQRVAEDFAPFDVNVTTEDPGAAALSKSGTGDSEWGIRVVIGGSSTDWYGKSAGGVAYVNSFNWSTDTPAFVFENQLGNGNEKYTAEAISHEIGHTLGLRHDGRTSPSESYYRGHGSGEMGWAPLMGVGYYQNVTQWSKGEYAYANNLQDDLAIITSNNGFGYRPDDHGNSFDTASLLSVSGSVVTDFGIIERTDDVDVFTFTTSGGLIDLAFNPAPRGPNLNILAELYDSARILVAASDPLHLLSASLNLTVAAGTYFLQISGVGFGDPTTGFSDYASLGQYFISGTLPATTHDSLSIAATDAAKLEGDAGTTNFLFTVSRSGNTSLTTSVNYHVEGLTANAADFAGGVLPSGTLVFAPGEVTKTIVIGVAGDTVVEPDEAFRVRLSNASGSTQITTSYADGLIKNDDFAASPGITVTALTSLITTESGGTAKFSVVLDTRPTADVSIEIVSLNTSEGVVDKSLLVFTPSNWSVAQDVTVQGVDDAVKDGNVRYTVELRPAQSSDPAYDGIDPPDVDLVNQDNEKGNGNAGANGNGNGRGGGPKKGPAAHSPVSFWPAGIDWEALLPGFVEHIPQGKVAYVATIGPILPPVSLSQPSHDSLDERVAVSLH